jgi:hypothetical protein
MIDLGSIAGLFHHDHELRAHCVKCARWSVIDLAALVAAGHGGRRLPLPVRCRDCRNPGQLQVRPPMPAWTNSNGWT